MSDRTECPQCRRRFDAALYPRGCPRCDVSTALPVDVGDGWEAETTPSQPPDPAESKTQYIARRLAEGVDEVLLEAELNRRYPDRYATRPVRT